MATEGNNDATYANAKKKDFTCGNLIYAELKFHRNHGRTTYKQVSENERKKDTQRGREKSFRLKFMSFSLHTQAHIER
jgi:hypothetical protein